MSRGYAPRATSDPAERSPRGSKARKTFGDAAGYSLVEVMAAILLFSVVIIPMVGMFDTGLDAANSSGNYDIARSLANKKLEQAKSLSYADARDKFPRASDVTPGTYGPIDNTTETGLPGGFSYTVSKRHLVTTSGANNSVKNLAVANTALGDTGLLEMSVTINWDSGKSYTTTGVVAKSVP